MPIEFIKGLPRGGKTLYALQRIVDELCEEFPRVIVTNLVLRHFHLADVIAARLKISRTHALMRVNSLCYYLPQHELKDFYRRRGFGHYFRAKDDITIEGVACRVPAYDSHFDEWSVFYVIDEVHVIYPISAHRDDLEAISYYLSQHGKVGGEPFDHVIVISQHPDQTAKKFKLLVQRWHSVRNRYMDKVGPFKLGSYFVRKEYMTEPKLGTTAIDGDTFDFNKEIADCYDTLAGVGMRGRGNPRIAHAKGFPKWTLWVGALGICFLLFFGVAALPRLVNGAFAPKNAALPESGNSTKSPDLAAMIKKEAASMSSPVQTEQTKRWPIRLEGDLVTFNDGTQDHVSRHCLTVRARHFAVVDGVRVPVIWGQGPRP